MAGNDEIKNVLLKQLPDVGLQFLRDIFNTCAKKSYFVIQLSSTSINEICNENNILNPTQFDFSNTPSHIRSSDSPVGFEAGPGPGGRNEAQTYADPSRPSTG